MLLSLRLRMFLLTICVLLVAGGMAMYFASGTIVTRFKQYLVWEQVASEERRQHLEALLPQILANHYAENGNWTDVEALVQEFSKLAEERIFLTDKTGAVIIDTTDGAATATAASRPKTLIPIQVKGQTVGAFSVLSLPVADHSSSAQEYISSINRALFLAIGMAGVIAIGLTFLLSRGILHRLDALTTAVQKMERGDLRQRVANGAKDEIGKLAHAFNAMADSLARIEQLRRNMVSDVAHELRTPLSNIRGYLEAIQDGLVQPTRETIDSLFEEAMLLNRLVDDLQELAMAEAGQLKLARQPVVVGEIVEKALQTVQCRAGEQQICLSANVAPNLPTLSLDAERIGQVLRNLLNNAVEYTPPGGQVTVNAKQVNGQVQVSVYNNGIGVSPEHLPYLFERFYRVDHSRTRKTGGRGLGLAIVKQLVEAHGGEVWAQSTQGKDATFFFTLPVGQEPGDRRQETESRNRTTQSAF